MSNQPNQNHGNKPDEPKGGVTGVKPQPTPNRDVGKESERSGGQGGDKR